MQREKLVALFEEIDLDHNGTVAYEEIMDGYDNSPEFRAVFESMALLKEDVASMLDLADEDGSGDADYMELADLMLRLKSADFKTMVLLLKKELQIIRRKQDNSREEIQRIGEAIVGFDGKFFFQGKKKNSEKRGKTSKPRIDSICPVASPDEKTSSLVEWEPLKCCPPLRMYNEDGNSDSGVKLSPVSDLTSGTITKEKARIQTTSQLHGSSSPNSKTVGFCTHVEVEADQIDVLESKCGSDENACV